MSVGLMKAMLIWRVSLLLRCLLTQHSAAQHSAAQRSTAQHSAAQHSTAQHSTAQHSTAQHTAQRSTTQHSNVLVAVHLLQDARPYRRTHAYLAAACCAELLQPPGLQRQPQMRFQPRLAVPS